MAKVVFTLSDEHLTRVIDAFCFHYGYAATLITGEPNPESRGEFTRRIISEWIRAETKKQERRVTLEAVPPTVEVDIT